MQRITVSWLSFHTISRTSSSLWILASINQQRNLSQTSSTHGMLIELANNCQTELHFAMLKYPSNWVIWNLFVFGGLLGHAIISNTEMISLSKVSMLQGSMRLSHVQTMSSHEWKILSMNGDNNKIFSSFFAFFSWKHENLIWSFESIDFLIFLPNIPPIVPFWTTSTALKVPTTQKKQKKALTLEN